MSAQLTATTGAEGIRKAAIDGSIVAWRNLKRVPRIPELAIFAIIQSIMFVLLFAFVFGGAIPLPGGESYREFLMPGIFAQTICFAAATTAIGMTEDVKHGIIDRFRSLPMARSAVLSGRAHIRSDLQRRHSRSVDDYRRCSRLESPYRSWRFFRGRGPADALHLCHVMGGHLDRSLDENSRIRPADWIHGVVPADLSINRFRAAAYHADPGCNRSPSGIPSARLSAATRGLWGNPNPYAGSGFPSDHPILLTLIWIVVIVAVFAPLGVRKYRALNN